MHDPLVITGATGQIGHAVLACLLQHNRSCMVLVRNGSVAERRLGELLAHFELELAGLVRTGRLIIVEGDLTGRLEAKLPAPARALIHAAGCTRFHTNNEGDPARTNVQGTAALLKWATRYGIESLHVVSTAYVNSLRGRGMERIAARRPLLRNAYEESKWRCENLCLQWAEARPGRSLTVLRPSIVVGDSRTGRTTSHTGFYLMVRAFELVSHMRQRLAPSAPEEQVRLPSLPGAAQNLVPIDYVAAMIAGIIEHGGLHGRVYHLTNPAPPSNAHIRDAMQRHLGVTGIELVDPATRPTGDHSTIERIFFRAAEPVLPYLADNRSFDRTNARAAERVLGLSCPAIDDAVIGRLCAFATGALRIPGAHGLTGSQQDHAARELAHYFEEFLPQNLPRSRVAQLAGVTATVRFIIHHAIEDHWVCTFERGRLAMLHRGCNGVQEDFGYRTDAVTFWQTVRGTADPQQAFMSGRAMPFGNLEQALKLAMILRQFHSECPYPEARNA